jgi:hypothetical protein
VAPPSALAQTSLHASGSAAVGYSDNILNAPTEPEEGDPERLADGFLLVSPGLMLVHETQRMRLTLEYQRPVQLYFTEEGNETSGDIGNLAAAIEASDVDTVVLGLTGARTTSYQVAGAVGGGGVAGASVSTEAIDYFQLGATELWAHQLSDDWHLGQSATFASVIPLEEESEDNRGSAGVSGSVTYRFGDNAVGLEVGVEGSLLPVSDDLVAAGESDRLPIFTRAALRYRRDFDENWSGDAAGGVVVAVDPLTEEHYVGPIWSGGVHWTQDTWLLSLTYARDVSPNLVTQQITLADAFSLNGGVPIVESLNIAALASTGVSINQDLSLDPEVQGAFYVWTADVGIGWLPPDLPQVAVRYVHLQQFGIEERGGPVQNLYTNQVIASVGWLIPSRTLPIIGRPTTRVDQGDPPEGAATPEETASPP